MLTFTPWGKTPDRLAAGAEPYPLTSHLLDAAVCAGAIWDHWMSSRLRGFLADALSDGDHDQARTWVMLTAGLHDVGKASSIFQMQSASPLAHGWQPGMADRIAAAGLEHPHPSFVNFAASDAGRCVRRHEYLSFTALTKRGLTSTTTPKLTSEWLPTVASGHHGVWHMPVSGTSGDDVAEIAKELCTGGWGEVQGVVIGQVAAAVGVHPDDAPALAPELAPTVTMLLTGLTILADWVASTDDTVMAGFDRIASGTTWGGWLEARGPELAALVRSTFGWFNPPGDVVAEIIGADDQGVPYSPRPLQQDVLDGQVGDGLWVVAYPTGEGKTEAALLRHVQRDDEGLIFALPTRATTDAMHDRLVSTLGQSRNSVIPSHQFAAARKVHCASEYGLDWFSTSIRRLVAPVVSATCDQVLVGALRQKHIALRLLALANHHLVLDEVHTYDQYQSALLVDLLTFLGTVGARVTLLSATLPAEQQAALVAAYQRGQGPPPDGPTYPSHQCFEPTGTTGPVLTPELVEDQPDLVLDVITTTDPVGAHTDWVLRAHETHPNCHLAVVVSTVDRAVETARSVRAALAGRDIDVICLHSRMTVAHRQRIEADLLHRLGRKTTHERPLVAIATQVIEASLDIDFDLMDSEIAPSPSLIQRAGRLWRFRGHAGLATRAARFGHEPARRVMRVTVTVDDSGSVTRTSALPYFAAQMRRVQAWATKQPVISIPGDVQAFVDDTAFDVADPLADLDEVADDVAKNIASNRSSAGLAELVGIGRYRHLHHATDSTIASTDEALMRTRYIEDEGRTFVLLGPGHHQLDVLTLAAATGTTALLDALAHVIPASRKHAALLETAHQATLHAAGTAEWDPTNRALRYLYPVDVTLLPQGLTYDPDLGLVA